MEVHQDSNTLSAAVSKPSVIAPPLTITENLSPELAIKMAYDFARRLRMTGWTESDFPECLGRLVEAHYCASPLLIYIRAGFSAGYFYDSLPWRRQIEATSQSPS